MLQQVTAEVRPRLAAQVNSAVSFDRTPMVNIILSHHFFCPWYMTKHISHTCGRRSCRPARYLSISTHSQIYKRGLTTARVSSSVTTGQCVLNEDVDPKRLGSDNTMKETRKVTPNDTAGIVAAVLVVASSVLFFMNRLCCVCRISVPFLGSWLKERQYS